MHKVKCMNDNVITIPNTRIFVQQVKNGQRFEKNRKQIVIKKVLKSTRIYLDF